MIQNFQDFTYNPNQQYLFRRAYSIAIGAPNQTTALFYANFSVPGPNGPQQPSPLRISFDIEKTSVGAPNHSKFQIYNLSTISRQGIKKGYLVQLQAGYNGLIQTLFTGNVAANGIKSERAADSSIITTLECGDGESAIVQAIINPPKSYPSGTTLAQIIQDVADAMSIQNSSNPVGMNAGIAVGIPSVTYTRGITISGFCRDILDTLLKGQGLRWSVQNGNLDIVPLKSYDQKKAIVVASGVVTDPNTGQSSFNAGNATGLIGVPSMNAGQLEFTSLLNPELVPNTLIQMISENTALNGFYKIVKAHYEGDTHEQKWQATCQCIPMPNVGIVLPSAQGFDYQTAVV